MSTINDIPVILSTLRTESDPQLSPFFYSFEDLYGRKLWHQLTKVLDDFFKTPLSKPVRTRLYNQFISQFKYNINQIKLIEFLLYATNELQDPQESLTYLEDLLEDLSKKENIDKSQALLFIQIEIARNKLRAGDDVESKEILDEIDSKLEKIDSVDLKLNQSYFSTNAEYYKTKHDYNNFYYQALLFLSTIELDELETYEQQKLAYELSVSALLADKIYNFGELLTHPILQTLQSTEHEWLIKLLNSLNSGDLNKFSELLSNLSKSTILKESEPFLRQKICLMTLVELVFSKSIRTISFKDVSIATRLSLNEVEHLVMKALSLGLLKGSIDQVEQTITINWVQPRIVNTTQIENMKERLVEWDSNVAKLGQFMEENGKEIWVD
ncbi:hypothetical protein WICMUC_002373 [Wickerhamomyces mucosus]|uniref:PCI domain-containing protein n=1 Tax=Wickerhamomyces mucosus TaxID=1378264 RepID=A0A9P8PPZ5_9ASCO|nr:hypothetical protein WICMUC_002373 [Wickerhamomyces mucosus]